MLSVGFSHLRLLLIDFILSVRLFGSLLKIITTVVNPVERGRVQTHIARFNHKLARQKDTRWIN